MSDEFNTGEDETPLVKQLRTQLKEANKTLKEFEVEVSEFRSAKRTATLAEALSSKGLPAKVAKLVPADLEAEKLDEWIADYADVFGLKVQEADPAPDAEQLARQRVSNLEANTAPASGDLQQLLAQATSAEDIIALINSGRTI